MISNPDFFVSFEKKGGGSLQQNAAQSFYSTANWLPETGYNKDQQGSSTYWKYNSNGDTINYLENYRFNIDNPTESLSNYDIIVNTNSEKGPAPAQLWLAIGNEQMQAEDLGGGRFKFDLSNSEIEPFVNAYDGNNKAIKQFTIQPYDRSSGDQYFGRRFLSVSVGPPTYNVVGNGAILDTNAVDLTEIYTSNDSQLKPKKNLGWNESGGVNPIHLEGGEYEVMVGSVADWLLRMDYDGPNKNKQAYSIVVDNELDTNNKLISQAVLYRKVGTQAWSSLQLDNSRKIAVTSSKDGLIDGTQRLFKPFVDGTLNKFENKLLNLQAQPNWNGKNGENLSARAISVAGVTFKNPPKGNESSVRLNYDDSVDWYSDPTGDANKDYSTRLLTAISNAESNNFSSRFFAAKGETVAPVYMFDNRLIGNWVDGSDGFEVLSPQSYFERNTIQAADDNIKVGSNSSIYKDTTQYQGHSGASVNYSDYGEANGPITNNTIDGIWVHRATQLGPQFDNIGGLISNKTTFGDPLIGGDWSKGSSGIYQNTLNRLFVPSFFFDEVGYDANTVSDTGIFSALKDSNFPIKDDLIAPDGTTFLLGYNNTFNDINIASSKNAKPLLFAFGTLNNISYSGDFYNLDGNNLTIPYPGQVPGGVDTIHVDYLGLNGNPFIELNIS